MKKPHIAVSLLLFSSLGFTVNAQQHVHGQGELLVSQEGNMLHLQLVLPAADALGFEHEPETTEQLNSQNLLAERFTLNTNVIDVEGKCELVNVEHTLETHDDHHESGHDEAHNEAHEGEHASHKEHDEHEDHEEHEEENHQNIEVEYQFHCDDVVSGITVALFESMPSLSAIQAQWITERGQGLSELSAGKPTLSW
ncbi:hypothetical protein AVL56_18830 [Alteromonas stellipolaris]|jgi:hypothetical protein|uniref:ZrgA family zinc uptake protein n=1 Tax=Alteromonas TaxID=226 RepID=UPI00077046A6|nr:MULTISPECIES: DUF2796 domain-containing protein [Alteromonas]AMJ92325.1 hypothetical protein AV940_18675 [Alteromonas sp. Mac2]AMJ88471.1 hypothetical protein AV939_18980 [Alteromonas sp. Mac1]AMJ96163.1 hypothetical protein AVL56_18830 [Alteromonas stellipolaris]ANB20811.1 hypothetical protein A6K25_05630 [Alteromonas stellipolaris]ANB25310.1 hypothetical protein A6F57_08930 [Alteromonas stellipolaris]